MGAVLTRGVGPALVRATSPSASTARQRLCRLVLQNLRETLRETRDVIAFLLSGHDARFAHMDEDRSLPLRAEGRRIRDGVVKKIRDRLRETDAAKDQQDQKDDSREGPKVITNAGKE